MKNIAIVVNPKKDLDFICLSKVIDTIKHLDVNIYIDKALSFKNDRVILRDKKELFSGCDLVVSIGGDGTFLEISEYLAINNIPIIGINMGHIGYITELDTSDIDKLCNIITGKFIIEKRMMLDISIYNENNLKSNFLVLNDAVISRGHLSRMINLSLICNEKTITEYRADGLIIATPTGSTAYSLSAGGPIIDPVLNTITATPICTHSISARPIVFSSESVLKVKLDNNEETIFLTGDGYKNIELSSKDVIKIKKSEHFLSLVRINKYNFYELLNKKLS
ncbi:MAG: NAD(+)/NADH kinase [Clostridia bacterium]